jgi:predicted Zn-dependent protease
LSSNRPPLPADRIEDLRRRVQADPASIAVAQLGEELRRAGHQAEAADVCRQGLAKHPAYLSARVTLARALAEIGHLADAQSEFEQVLRSASDNLAAMRGLGDVHHRRGATEEALACYRAALDIAPNDPDIEVIVASLEREVRTMQEAVAAAVAAEPPVAVSCDPEPVDPAREQALRTVAALEHWLAAINVACADRRA